MQLWYPIAKTLAEKAGWEYAKETGYDVVMINPGTALGPLIPPRLNSSMAVLLGVLKGLLFFSPSLSLSFCDCNIIEITSLTL